MPYFPIDICDAALEKPAKDAGSESQLHTKTAEPTGFSSISDFCYLNRTVNKKAVWKMEFIKHLLL